MKKDYITHMVIAAFLLLVLAAFLGPKMTDAQTLRIFTPTQGGTGIGSTTAGNVGNCLKVLDDSPFTYELGTCGTGGGSGGGFPTYFQNGGATLNTATTTVNFTANSFAVTEDPTDTLTIRVATTTLGLLTTNVSEGSNLYYTDARVSSYMSASSTYSNLLSFYTTPSTRITAGTGIDWSGNTLNGVYTAGDALTLNGEDFDFDGGASPAGALGGTWASPTVDDDGHNHTGTTLSGIDISDDTNLSADGTEIVLTGDALSLGTLLTFTSATATNIATNLATTSIFYGAGLQTCNGASNALIWSAGSFGCNSITGSGGGSNWTFNGTRLTPSSTVGIVVNASSTITDLNSTNATATNLFANTTFKMGSDQFTDLTGFGLTNSSNALGILTTGAADGECLVYSSTGPTIDWTTCGSGGGGSGGGWATTTDTNDDAGELITQTSYDAYIGGSASTSAEFNFDPETAKLTISSTTASASGTILAANGGLLFGKTGETTELNWNTANVLKLYSSTGVDTFDFGDLRSSSTLASTTALTVFSRTHLPYLSDGCLNVTSGVLGSTGSACASGSGDGVSNWLFDGTRLTPSTTVGIGVFASSTISLFSSSYATITNATSTSLFSALGTFTNMVVNTLATFLNVVVTGLLDVGDGVLEIPNGTGSTSNDPGEVSHDTSDNQLIMDDFVVGRATERIWSVTVASTSPYFIAGTNLAIPDEADGYTMTSISCKTVTGTSKAIIITDGTNATESITCDSDGATDDGSITNASVTAGEDMYIDFGATSGAVDTVSISVYGQWTRE